MLRYTNTAHPPGSRPAGRLRRRRDIVTASRLTALALLTLTLALAYFATATTAGARPIPAPDGGGDAPHSPLSPLVVMNHTGSPVWTYLVVALAAAGLSLALAWAVSRLPHSHTSVVHAQA